MPVLFNPPPGWRTPPGVWLPPLSWTPDKKWPPAPKGWEFYSEVSVEEWEQERDRRLANAAHNPSGPRAVLTGDRYGSPWDDSYPDYPLSEWRPRFKHPVVWALAAVAALLSILFVANALSTGTESSPAQQASDLCAMQSLRMGPQAYAACPPEQQQRTAEEQQYDWAVDQANELDRN